MVEIDIIREWLAKANEDFEFALVNLDEIVKSPKTPFSVIPAEAGIQCFRGLAKPLDPGFHRGDDFLRSRQP